MAEKTTVVITGATGFIGRNILARYAGREGCFVRAVYHQRPAFDVDAANVEWIQGDLTVDADVRRILDGADTVIQCAATTSGAGDIVNRPYIHTTDNAVMNSLMLRACYDLNVAHFLFFSCSIMYQPSEVPLREEDFSESDILHPNYFPAGWTKVYLEKMCEFFAGLGRTKMTVLRHTNIFGPHDKYDLERSHMFGATVTKVMTAEEGGTIKVWGSGEEARDLLYVDDLADCVESCLANQTEPFGLYNVGYGQSIKVIDVVRKIIGASGKNLSIERDERAPTIPVSIALDCGRIQSATGWSPTTDFDDAVSRTTRWRAENRPV